MKSKNQLHELVRPFIKGKDVLELGAVNHTLATSLNPIWLHKFLVENSKSAKGIDILKEEVEELRKRGYDIEFQNAENFKFDKKFDVIFAGNIIEHLSNPGLMLECCKKCLKDDGLLLISTNHPFSLWDEIIGVFKLSNTRKVNPEHTCYYSPATLKELLRRYDFGIEK